MLLLLFSRKKSKLIRWLPNILIITNIPPQPKLPAHVAQVVALRLPGIRIGHRGSHRHGSLGCLVPVQVVIGALTLVTPLEPQINGQFQGT